MLFFCFCLQSSFLFIGRVTSCSYEYSFSFTIPVQTGYIADTTVIKNILKEAFTEVRDVHSCSRSISYAVEQGAYSARKRLHKTNSWPSFIMYER